MGRTGRTVTMVGRDLECLSDGTNILNMVERRGRVVEVRVC